MDAAIHHAVMSRLLPENVSVPVYDVDEFAVAGWATSMMRLRLPDCEETIPQY
jgi:hypothetical protein